MNIITTNAHGVERVTVGRPEVLVTGPDRSLTTVEVTGFNGEEKVFSVCFFGLDGQIIKVENGR